MADKPGLGARRLALELIDGVVTRQRPLDEAFEAALAGPHAALEARDRAFARALAAAALRRAGELQAVLDRLLGKPLPRSSGPTRAILLLGAAELLFLDGSAHAATDLAVTLAKADSKARHFADLVNAVLRRIAREGLALLSGLDALDHDTPAWLSARWRAAYGETITRAIAASHLVEPAIDLSVARDPALWAERLGATLLPGGTIRLEPQAGRIEALPGFAAGAWWVQDAAAALPARLLGDVRAKRVLDLCAAPGGKTAQLAAHGAAVTAVDKSRSRLNRLDANLKRLKLGADLVWDDALTLGPEPVYDAVLLDAPCAATGTIRRHPDLPFLKSNAQIVALADLQARLLAKARLMVRPGGLLVYCACSLEPEEGELQIARFLDAHGDVERVPVTAAEVAGQSHFISPAGDLRTLPCMTIGSAPGLDGFYAARLRCG